MPSEANDIAASLRSAVSKLQVLITYVSAHIHVHTNEEIPQIGIQETWLVSLCRINSFTNINLENKENHMEKAAVNTLPLNKTSLQKENI